MHSCAVPSQPSVPTPTQRKRKQEHIRIASHVVFTLAPALSCPGRGLHLSFLDYWINLLSDTAASTQNSTEEEQWTERQTRVLTLALLLCAFGRSLTLHLGLHLGHLDII